LLNTQLYFAGSAPLKVDEYLVEKGYNRLFSQLNDRSRLKRWMGYKDQHPGMKLFVDSGAFSAYTKGKEIDLDDYIAYLNEYGRYFDVMVQVDYIPGKSNVVQDRQVYLDAPRVSWENFLHMRERLDKSLWDRFIPVFHEGEDFSWLENMLRYKDADGRPLQYIGISPHTETTTDRRLVFCKEVFQRIKRINPEVKTHGFGMTALNILQYIDFTSVDSTTWLKGAIYGTVLIPRHNKLAAMNVGERTTGAQDHFCWLGAEAKEEVCRIIEEAGFSTERLRKIDPTRDSDEIMDDGVEDITNNIAIRQMFNAASMIRYLHDTPFLGLPKSARRIGNR
jgi:hypothetical protein